MEWGTVLPALIAAAAAVSGMVLGWTARTRDTRHEIRADAGSSAALRSDVEYIKRGVDDLRLDIKDQGRRFDELAERVTRVEESSKQAHKRIDRLDGVERGADD